jgi:hypothetical protein
MLFSKKIFLIVIMLGCTILYGQRNYTNNSVLSNGTWYKLAINESGIYKLDVAMLNTMGFNTTSLQSGTIKIYGNTGAMLAENCASTYNDDLQENAIFVNDGGDGIFNGNDFLLFYAQGTTYWLKDSINAGFKHQKNLYANEAFYYVTIGANGKRIANTNIITSFNQTVNSYNERVAVEDNKTSLLNTGKEWVGDQLSNLPGQSLQKNYSINLPLKVANEAIKINTSLVARSATTANFNVFANGINIQQINIAPVSGGALDVFANTQTSTSVYTNNTDNQLINVQFNPSSATAQGWVNYITLQSRCNLQTQNNKALFFRDWQSVGNNNVSRFLINNVAADLQVWDITNAITPIKQTLQINSSVADFIQSSNYLREYVAFTPSTILTPRMVGAVANQNLHNTQPIHYLIITNKLLLPEAEKLATFHRSTQQIQVKVATVEQIVEEFGSGIKDISAVRNYVKMYFDKYNSNTIALQNVLLFGDASFDYLDRVSGNTNLVPSWQSVESFHTLTSYVSDDFFGYLSDNDDINSITPSLLDVGIGRVPAKNLIEAKQYVDKVLAYNNTQSIGSWRNQVALIADDEDGNLHLNDAETMSNTIQLNAPNLVQDKIYLDGYRQESASGGSRYPLVNNAITNKINTGTLIFNYSGHGGSTRLADESILNIEMTNNWQNEHKLPLFITATCDFAAYDEPLTQSIGENLLLQNKNGAIALMTTTRIVFAYSNKIINNNYLQYALQRNANGNYYNLGQTVKQAKNYTIQSGGDVANSRKFTLLGDPYITLSLPKHIVKTTKINDRIYTPFADTINALKQINITGEVQNVYTNSQFNNFNGLVQITVYDKKQLINTLVNDAASIATTFSNNGNILFKGSASVVNGKFDISFLAPKDMQYNLGQGVISYYAHNDTIDANGNDAITIGGSYNNSTVDEDGPSIKAYLNDTKFVNGSITNQKPILLVYLNDSSGINTSNIGIGHEITAILDGDTRNVIVLNNNYSADLGSYKNGSIQYMLPTLTPGKHVLAIKAWDVRNNPSTINLDFEVVDDNVFKIDRLLNYPNPFTTKTTFWWEHNKPNENLNVLIDIFSITGKLINQLKHTINTTGNRSCSVEWDGKDMYNNKIASGVYVYIMTIRTSSGQKIIKKEKLFKF